MSKFVADAGKAIVKDNGTFQIMGYVEFEKPRVIDKVTIASWTKASDKSVSMFPIMDTFTFVDQNEVEWVCTKVENGRFKFTKKKDLEVTR
jgi:hypothetical protein